MASQHGLLRKAVDGFNGCVVAQRDSPRWGRFVSDRITVVTYTGRRSGNTFSTPVGYRRTDDVVTIGVRMPDIKTWWRNFSGEGRPLTLRLDGADRTGHATARRDGRGRVTVTVRLTD